MDCTIFDRVNNKILSTASVVEFRGRTLTVRVEQSEVAQLQKCILTCELGDGSFRGEVEVSKVGSDYLVFKVAKSGIFDRRRYLRVQTKQRAKIFIDGHDDMITLTEVAYMSCRLIYCGRRLSIGEHVIIKIEYGNGEIKVDGEVMQYCGSFGHGALESQIYIVTFEGYNAASIDSDMMYSYIQELASGSARLR